MYVPKHGSWLNIAEIELTVLIGQYLRRMDNIEVVRKGHWHGKSLETTKVQRLTGDLQQKMRGENRHVFIRHLKIDAALPLITEKIQMREMRFESTSSYETRL